MKKLALTLSCAALALLAGCNQSSSHGGGAPAPSTAAASTAPVNTDVLTKLNVIPDAPITIEQGLGAGFQLVIDGQFTTQAGETYFGDMTRDVSYRSLDPTVARVDGAGLVTPIAPGTTTIEAWVAGSFGQIDAAQQVTVVPPSGSAPTFKKLEIYPEHRALRGVIDALGRAQVQQIVVLGTDENGRLWDLTRSIGVKLTDLGRFASTSATLSPLGLLRGEAEGEVLATARIEAARLVAGGRYVLGLAPSKPATSSMLYSGAPLVGSSNPLDRAVLEGLRAAGIEPAPLASDGEFLRRLYHDALRRTPTEAELAAFLADAKPNKRGRAIDAVLADPELVERWAASLGEWLTMPRHAIVVGTKNHTFDMQVPSTLLVEVDGGRAQTVTFEAGDFGNPAAAFDGEVVNKINRVLQGARADRPGNGNVIVTSLGVGPTSRLRIAGGTAAPILGLDGQEAEVFDRWASEQLKAGKSLSQVFQGVAEGAAQTFEAAHATAADKVDVLLQAGAGMTARCAKCHDHPLTGPSDTIRWKQAERYPLDAFFAVAPGEATIYDGKQGIRVGAPLQPAFVLDRSQPVTVTLASPLAARRVAFGRLFAGSRAFQRGVAHRLFAELVVPLLDPNQFLQKNVDEVAVPAVLEAVTELYARVNGALPAFLRELFGSRFYQLSSSGRGLDPKQDALLQRRVARLRQAEPVDGLLDAVTGQTLGRDERAFVHETFGYPELRQSVTERLEAVNLSQPLLLLNSPIVQGRVSSPQGRVAALAAEVDAKQRTLADAIQVLWRASLSREATADELRECLDVAQSGASTREGLEDVAAALLGSVEFALD